MYTHYILPGCGYNMIYLITLYGVPTRRRDD